MINKRRQVMMLIRGDDTVTKMNKNEKKMKKTEKGLSCIIHNTTRENISPLLEYRYTDRVCWRKQTHTAVFIKYTLNTHTLNTQKWYTYINGTYMVQWYTHTLNTHMVCFLPHCIGYIWRLEPKLIGLQFGLSKVSESISQGPITSWV